MWRAIGKKERNKKTKQRTYNILWITTLKVLRLLVEQYNWKLNVLNKANEMRIKKNIIFYDRPSSQAKPRWNIKKKKSYKKYLCTRICSHFICIKMVLLMLFFAFFNYRFNGDASAVKTECKAIYIQLLYTLLFDVISAPVRSHPQPSSFSAMFRPSHGTNVHQV